MSDSCNPVDCSRQAPLSMGFSRQKYWSVLPFPPPGHLPNPGIKPASPVLTGRFFTTTPLENPKCCFHWGKKWWLCEMMKVFHNVCCCSVAQSCLTLWDAMDCSTPGFPVLHYLQEFAQTHVHWVSDAIQPSYPLSPPSPPALNLFPHQGLFQWLGSSHQGAKVLEFQLQHQAFQWIFRADFSEDQLVWSPCCSSDSQESSPATQFKSINSLALSCLYGPVLTTTGKTIMYTCNLYVCQTSLLYTLNFHNVICRLHLNKA